jgi:hypothetical protein
MRADWWERIKADLLVALMENFLAVQMANAPAAY